MKREENTLRQSPIDEEKIRRYQEDGFVNGGPLISENEVEALREELTRVIESRPGEGDVQPVLKRNLNEIKPEAGVVWQIVNIWQASSAFEAVAKNPHLAAMAAALQGARELRIWHDQIQYKPEAEGGPAFWHQDSMAWAPILPKGAQITAWIALDDAEPDNGCMSMVPGSQLWGENQIFLHGVRSEMSHFHDLPRYAPNGQAIGIRLCPVKAGHVHFHHGMTWHGSHANRSRRKRRAIAVHFMTEETVFRKEGNHPMMPYIPVAPGEKIAGDTFPLVWSLP